MIVYISGRPATVLSEETGKRGKTLLTVRFDNGEVRKVDERTVSRPAEFAPADPTALSRPINDYYGDVRHMFRR